MNRIMEALWEFHCPECGFGHGDFGRLARDHEIYCEVCEHEEGRLIRLHRWLAENPELQARVHTDPAG